MGQFNERYYIGTGAKNCFYTLRYEFEETVYLKLPGGAVDTKVVPRDYHICNLSIDREQAIAKALELTGKDLSASFEVETIARRRAGEVDWSVFHFGKYEGESIHEVRQKDPDYLIWVGENYNSQCQSKTIEMIKALMEHELAERQQQRDQEQILREARQARVTELCQEIAERLADGQGGFRDSVARDFSRGEPPSSTRARNIVVDILAKEKGRRNSQGYAKESEALWDLLDRIDAAAAGEDLVAEEEGPSPR